MEKDFDSWNKLKKNIDKKEIDNQFNFHAGDIWWTTLGINVGSEINGKHETFERPILIIKVINKHTLYALPLTSKDHFTDKYHQKITYDDKQGVVVFSQVKVISSKRLLRKVSQIKSEELKIVKDSFIKLFL